MSRKVQTYYIQESFTKSDMILVLYRAYPLAKILIGPLKLEKIPEIWKCANIVPIYKQELIHRWDKRTLTFFDDIARVGLLHNNKKEYNLRDSNPRMR